MIEVEDIPNPDGVARHVEFPRTYNAVKQLVLDTVFEFPGGRAESLVWRKYAATDAEVIALGREWEKLRQARKPDTRYEGFITSTAGAIRSIKTAIGHGFSVVHHPPEGVHHAHVQYEPAEGKPFERVHRAELKLALRLKFSKVPVSP